MPYVAKGDEFSRVDPRQLNNFMRVPGFVQSLTPTQYGSMFRRILTAGWTPEERIVYDAVIEGYTSLDSLPVATGLTSEQIRGALDTLTGRGYVRQSGVELESKEFAL